MATKNEPLDLSIGADRLLAQGIGQLSPTSAAELARAADASELVHLGGGFVYRRQPNGELVLDESLGFGPREARERDAKAAQEAEEKTARDAAEAAANAPSADDRRFGATLDAFWNRGGINGVIQHAGQDPRARLAGEPSRGPAPVEPFAGEIETTDGVCYVVQSDGSLGRVAWRNGGGPGRERIPASEARAVAERYLGRDRAAQLFRERTGR